jgi:CRP-like cAMP-binding protein
MNAILKNKIKEKITGFTFSEGANLYRMPADAREQIENAGHTQNVAKNEMIYRQDEPAKGVYILKKGKVKIWQLNPDGSMQILFIYSDGELFGHRPVFAHMRQPVSATALEDCELVFIEKEKFFALLERSGYLMKSILSNIGTEFSVLVNKINLYAKFSIRERLALSLLLLNETFKRSQQSTDTAEIVMNRTDLADYIGTSVENLVRTLKTFKESGYIRTQGKAIIIDDFEALYSISEMQAMGSC